MPHTEATQYIERLFPSLRKKYVRTEDDEDLCQLVLFDLLKKWPVLQITDDKGFNNVFARFYFTSKWVERSRRARSLASGTYWLSHAGGIPDCYYEGVDTLNKNKQGAHRAEPVLSNPFGVTTEYNPWNNNRVDAAEWIACLPTPLYRKVFTLYYIEGYTQSEVGVMVDSYRERVNVILQEGVVLLQKIHAAQAHEEGRTVREAPTPPFEGGGEN